MRKKRRKHFFLHSQMAEQGAEPSPLHLLDGMKAEDLQTLPGKPIFLRTNDTLAQALQVTHCPSPKTRFVRNRLRSR